MFDSSSLPKSSSGARDNDSDTNIDLVDAEIKGEEETEKPFPIDIIDTVEIFASVVNSPIAIDSAVKEQLSRLFNTYSSKIEDDLGLRMCFSDALPPHFLKFLREAENMVRWLPKAEVITLLMQLRIAGLGWMFVMPEDSEEQEKEYEPGETVSLAPAVAIQAVFVEMAQEQSKSDEFSEDAIEKLFTMYGRNRNVETFMQALILILMGKIGMNKRRMSVKLVEQHLDSRRKEWIRKLAIQIREAGLTAKFDEAEKSKSPDVYKDFVRLLMPKDIRDRLKTEIPNIRLSGIAGEIESA